jgi:hypothetical protein
MYAFRRLGQIVDCAYYLCQQTPDCDSRCMVSVLSVAAAASAVNISLPLKQMLAAAHQQGNVRTRHDFLQCS